jgi:phage replication initiation protein
MQTAIIDFLGVTFRLGDPTEARQFAELLIRIWIGPEAKLVDTGRGVFGYKHRIDIEGAGIIGFGGNDDTMHIELSGSGCVQVKDWEAVVQTIEEAGAKLTRVDVAGDDMTGEHFNLAGAKAAYHDGGFKPSRGTHPGSNLRDDMGTGKGCTLYVGSRESGKLFRGYEKGKQQGDPESAWFRCEVEYRAVHRELPVQMLTNPSAYLAGAYPYLEAWNIEQRQIRTVAHSASAALEKAVEHASKQAGRVIHALLTLNGGDVKDALARLHVPELPKRLCGAITAFLALEESERTYTTATAPAWAAKATPDELHMLDEAYRLPRAVWLVGQGVNGKTKPRAATGAPLAAFS